MASSQETAVLAGGCFWGMQDLLRRYSGVISTRVGYTGGDVQNATYRNHGTHAEALEVVFDPQKLSYRKLLEFFFQIHDPTTLNRQGNDVGTSYRSAIYYMTDEQKQTAIETIADVNAAGLWPGKVVTQIEPAGAFWEADQSTRITSSDTQMAILAISFVRIGAYRTVQPEFSSLSKGTDDRRGGKCGTGAHEDELAGEHLMMPERASFTCSGVR